MRRALSVAFTTPRLLEAWYALLKVAARCKMQEQLAKMWGQVNTEMDL